MEHRTELSDDAEGRRFTLTNYFGCPEEHPFLKPFPSFRVLPELLSRPPALHQRGYIIMCEVCVVATTFLLCL
jgi:hypothetical protein